MPNSLALVSIDKGKVRARAVALRKIPRRTVTVKTVKTVKTPARLPIDTSYASYALAGGWRERGTDARYARHTRLGNHFHAWAEWTTIAETATYGRPISFVELLHSGEPQATRTPRGPGGGAGA